MHVGCREGIATTDIVVNGPSQAVDEPCGLDLFIAALSEVVLVLLVRVVVEWYQTHWYWLKTLRDIRVSQAGCNLWSGRCIHVGRFVHSVIWRRFG